MRRDAASILAELKTASGSASEAEPPVAIDHPTLPLVIAASLRKMITAGTLAAGARLNERQLCEQLRVSRTPLREAYRILAAEGLVEMTPKHGARVVELSEDDVADIFDVLAVAEGLAGRLATERASETQVAHIIDLHGQMMDAYHHRDMVRYAVAAKATHDAINDAADNPPLREIYQRLNARVQKLRYRSNVDEGNWASSIAAHEAFVAALQARDAPRVESMLREHLLAKKALATGGPETGPDESGLGETGQGDTGQGDTSRRDTGRRDTQSVLRPVPIADNHS
jgi:DNA-binding GntR family transcriptional regulator